MGSATAKILKSRAEVIGKNDRTVRENQGLVLHVTVFSRGEGTVRLLSLLCQFNGYLTASIFITSLPMVQSSVDDIFEL